MFWLGGREGRTNGYVRVRRFSIHISSNKAVSATVVLPSSNTNCQADFILIKDDGHTYFVRVGNYGDTQFIAC